MLEESVPAAIWASMSSWFTPTVFFVVLNLVIGTIAVTSKAQLNSQTTKSEDGDDYNHEPRVLTSESSLLTRFKSINLHRYVSSVLPPTTESLEIQPEEKRPNITITTATAPTDTSIPTPTVESEFETLEEAYSAAKGVDFRRSRSESETHPAVETKRKVAMGGGLMRKSASEKKTEREEQGTDVVNLPPAAREEERGEGGEVDAMADDFINRFRKQLQLQRLNSILRYKEMQQMNGNH